MMTESTTNEATPLSQTTRSRLPELNVMEGRDSSALVTRGESPVQAADIFVSFTHAETFASTIDVLENYYGTTTATTATTWETHRRRHTRARPLHGAPKAVEDQIDRVNSERVELLARQYVSKDKFSNEEQARLAIVTERVRKLLPAVTIAEFEALEKNLQASKKISGMLDDLRARLLNKRG